MFTRPISYVPLKSIDEMKRFSIQLPLDASAKNTSMLFNQNSGWIVFTDEHGFRFLTPARPESTSILQSSGYAANWDIWVPDVPDYSKCEAMWLRKIAQEEIKAYTHQEAKKRADQKGIKEVTITEAIKLKEIEYDRLGYRPMVDLYLANGSDRNVGTYIIVDDKTLLVCDEYGRTFFIQVLKVIYSIVNKLIEAGYTRTEHPWWYVYDQTEFDPKRKLVLDELADDEEEK